MRERGIGAKLDKAARERELLPLLKQFANAGVQFSTMDIDAEFYIGRDVDGLVPFVIVGRLMLGLGEPLSAAEDQRGLAEEFMWFAKRRGKVPAFFPASQEFFDAMADLGFGGVETARESFFRLDFVDWDDPNMVTLREEAETVEKQWSHRWMTGKELGSEGAARLSQLERGWGGPVGTPPIVPLFVGQPETALESRFFSMWLAEGSPVGCVSMVPHGDGKTLSVEELFLDRDIDFALAGGLLFRTLECAHQNGWESLSLGPMVFETTPRGSLEGLPPDSEFPMVASVFTWVLRHVPALEQVRNAQRLKLLLVPQETRSLYLMFHPARPTADLLLNFVKAIFPGLNFKGMVQEVWFAFASRLMQKRDATENEE